MIYHFIRSYSIAFVLLILCHSANSQRLDSKQINTENKQTDFSTELVADKHIRTYFLEKAESLYNAQELTSFSKLNEQISNGFCNINFDNLQNDHVSTDYGSKKNGVLIIGKLYKCASCPKNHLITASAFAIGKDGLCVTNNHVFSIFPNDSNTYLAAFVMDTKGNVYPVEEVLAASEKNDLAVFKVRTNGVELTPVSLGTDIETGNEVSIVSHPDGQYYTYTKGYVSRKYVHQKHNTSRFSITAEFAKGSSGAPVFNNDGKVVGIVSATRSIYYQKGKNLQMVVREVIPVEGLKKLFTKEENKNKSVPGRIQGSIGIIP